MDKPLEIYCPVCNRKVGLWDGKSSINLVSKCVKCQKLVVFMPKTKDVVSKPLPPRATSSGKTFI